MDSERSFEAALRARENAYAPYSGFRVGAALETATGKVFAGCNVENATYGLTVCAERVALWKAMSEGEREFLRMVIVAESERVVHPCGACRQLLWEFCGDIEVTVANTQGRSETRRLRDLLPYPFDRTYL